MEDDDIPDVVVEAPDITAALLGVRSDAQQLHTDLDALAASQEGMQRILRRMQIILAGVVVAIVMLAFILIGLVQISRDAAHSAQAAQATNAQFQDCVVETGKCTQRQAASTAQLVLSVSWSAEALRDVTAIQVAQERGATEEVTIYRASLQKSKDTLDKIQQNIVAIQQNKPIPNEIPSVVPTTVPAP